MQRECKTCNSVKDINDFELTNKAGSRRGVCKSCYTIQKRERVEKASATHDPSSVPLPLACVSCGKGPEQVTFQWRTDVIKGGWRTACNACFNAKGYYKTYRQHKMDEDPDAFRAHNASTHLVWVHKQS